MDQSKLKLRAFLLYEFKLGSSAAAAARRISNICGQGQVSDRTAQFWFARFRSGNEDLNDEDRGGRPRVIDDEALAAIISANPARTGAEIAQELGCGESTVTDRLRELGFSKKLTKWVPHRLTDAQKLTRLQICSSLLLRHKNDPFIDRIVTCDEKWVLFDNVRRSAEWTRAGEPVGKSPKRDLHPKRIMMTVWWNRHGIVHVDFLPNRQTITADRYSMQLQEVHAKLLQKHAGLVNRKGVLLLHDNARSHTAVRTREMLGQLRWETSPHPPYSPDISPCDCYLFLSLTNFLAGKSFRTDDELKAGVIEFFESKGPDFYKRGIESLVERWQSVVDASGDYFDS